MPRQHLTRTYQVDAIGEDRLVALLSDCGTTGVEVRSGDGTLLLLIAYFDAPPAPHPALPTTVGTRHDGIEWLAEEWLEDRDWQAEFRRRAQPLEIGRRFLVDPGELEGRAVPPGDRFLLRLPARTAFGTGSHETTQLSLEWLERLDVIGRRVLDVGSGSGILSLAARRLGAARAVGFDLDLASALLSGQYERLNRENGDSAGGVCLWAGTGAALASAACFDVLLVNVLPHRVERDLPDLIGVLEPTGDAVVSGVILSEEQRVLDQWKVLGMAPVGRRQKGEWIAWHLRRETVEVDR